MTPDAKQLKGLPPVLDLSTMTIILGSFPGKKSLELGEYYANKGNQFWRIMRAIFSIDFPILSYVEKLKHLRECHVGLWDTISFCDRIGSCDVSIKNREFNNLLDLREAPLIKRICFNGKEAAACIPQVAELGVQCFELPSSSGLYASMTINQKIEIWRRAIPIIPSLRDAKPIKPLRPISQELITGMIRATRDAGEKFADEYFAKQKKKK